MQTNTVEIQESYQIRCSGLPLAVYLEIVAHLRQVVGVEVSLLPQTSQTFDYNESQVGGLLVNYLQGMPLANKEQVDQILAYYGDRYGAWERS